MRELDVDALAVVVQRGDPVAEPVLGGVRGVVGSSRASCAASLAAWLAPIQVIDEVCRSLSDTDRAFALDLLLHRRVPE